MKFSKIFFIFNIVALVVFGLSACGKVSKSVPVEGSGYPHTYPRR